MDTVPVRDSVFMQTDARQTHALPISYHTYYCTYCTASTYTIEGQRYFLSLSQNRPETAYVGI